MIRAQYLVLCDDARQSLNNTIDLLGLFDRVTVHALPAIHRRMTMVSLLVADNEDGLGKHPFSLTVVGPDGMTILRQEGVLALKADAGTWIGSARMMLTMEMFPLPITGRYMFRLQVDGKDVATHPLTVVLQKAGG